MADGTIRVSTKLDTSGIKADIKELEKELNNVRKEQAKVEAEANKAREKFDKEREIDSQFSDEFSHREDIDKRAAKELDGIMEKQEALNAKEKEYTAMLEQANAKLRERSTLTQASKELDWAARGEALASKITTQEQYNSLLEETRAKMEAIERAAERIALAHGVSKDELLAANPTYQKLSDTMGVLTSRTYTFESASRKAGQTAETSMRRVKRESNGLGTAIQGAIKRFGKMALAIFGIRGAYRAVRMAVVEYLATNEELAGQVQALKSVFAQVLGPAIEFVINLLLKAIAVVNAFVAALTGINFVARANAAALKKQAQAGGGGGNSTASFDEQTKLSGGGGGGSNVATLPDGSTIDLSFLDPLMEAIQKFKEDISPLIETVGNLFKWLWAEVLVPFGDWAANGVLAGFLNILGGAALVLNDALLLLQPVAQWLWDNVLEPIASWTGGIIVDVLNAIGDWIHKHHETLGTVAGVVGAIVAVLWGVPTVLGLIQGALALLFSPVTLIVGAVGGLIAIFVTCYDECVGFRDGMDKVWQGIKDIFFAAIDFIKAMFKGDWAGMEDAEERLVAAAKNLWEGLVEGLKAGWEWCKEKVAAIWGKIVEKFRQIFGIHSPSTLFQGFGRNMMEGLTNGIKNAISKVTSACSQIWSAIKGVFSNVSGWFKDKFTAAWTAVKNVFSTGGKIFDGIKEGIADTFKTIVNGLITGINKVIAAPFNSINSILNRIRSIEVLGTTPFSGMWSYNPLAVPQIPKLARGGIVNRPGRGVPAIIGEAGREAVLPLDNHTEWMDILADKINGSGTITIPIYMDGKKMYTYFVDVAKRKAFAANGG